MDFILEKCPRTVGISDDIAVHGPTEEEHDANLHNAMLVARQHGLVFSLDKCMIKEPKITFFGMYLMQEGYILTQKRWKLLRPFTSHAIPRNFNPSLV